MHLLIAIIYLAFISLGLPDALLGAAWPTIYPLFDVPISYAGVVSMVISIGTIISSLLSERMYRWLGTGKVTAISVAITAVSLFGFSFCDSFYALCIWAIPYGIGAGCVDSCLNNYVALHYESRHMSWLHCFWGVGATLGPYVMGFALTSGYHWTSGYRWIGFLQVALTAVLVISLPLWKKSAANTGAVHVRALTLMEVVRIPGAKQIMLCFFSYCAVEVTASLWASSYLAIYKGVPAETAASFAAMFFTGITVGRAISGFCTMKLSDTQMIRLGCGIIVLGIVAMLLPLGKTTALAGFVLIGMGCAPIYPCLIHSIPGLFGEEHSQGIIGVQMATAYCGNCLAPAVFGLLANHISVALLPFYLLIFLTLMVVMYEMLLQTVKK